MADQGQRSEQPTPRRIDKARKEGNYPTAREFVAAVQFLAFAGGVAAWGADWIRAFQESLRTGLARAFTAANGREAALAGADALRAVILPLAPLGAAVVLATVAAQLAVTGLGFSLKKLNPDFKRLNPLARLRDMRRQNIHSVIQAAIMLPVFGALIWMLARADAERYATLPLLGVTAGSRALAESLQELLWKAAMGFMVFGAVDLFRQRQRYLKDLRMTKQEIREEVKETEGNPQIKSRIRRIQRDAARRRMMSEVPRASAVIVNPTHYAVAIRYSMDSMAAPVVVAKGRNWLALRIRQIAVQNQVPIVENPPLAQALYKSVDVGQEIPVHLYRAVAEILAYIFRLMGGRR